MYSICIAGACVYLQGLTLCLSLRCAVPCQCMLCFTPPVDRVLVTSTQQPAAALDVCATLLAVSAPGQHYRSDNHRESLKDLCAAAFAHAGATHKVV